MSHYDYQMESASAHKKSWTQNSKEQRATDEGKTETTRCLHTTRHYSTAAEEPSASTPVPQRTKWGKAHGSELEEIDAMKAIDWHSQLIRTNWKNIILTTITYRYERDQKETIHNARCSIRGDQMKPNIHYDQDKKAT